jgi:hypothetical protein
MRSPISQAIAVQPISSQHVGYEEDAEHADHCVELGLRESEIKHVACAKVEVLEAALLRLSPRKFEQVLGQIHAENEPA